MTVQSVIDRIAATNIGSTLADMLRKNADRLAEIEAEIADLDDAMPTEKNTLDLAVSRSRQVSSVGQPPTPKQRRISARSTARSSKR